jgi:hypothetical protein
MFGPVIQFILALVIVILLMMLGYFVYNRDILTNLQTMRNRKTTTELIRGAIDLSNASSSLEIETNDQNSASYKPMPFSINQRSGGELTYNFWLWMDRDADGGPFAASQALDLGSNVAKLDEGLTVQDYILFYRGVNRKYTYNNVCSTSGNSITKGDILVKAPLVKLQQGGKYLTVEFNTVQGPDAHVYNGRNTCTETTASWSAMNRSRITIGGFDTNPNFNKQWFMVTVVIQDTLPEDPIPIRNKIRTRIYVNGILELDQYIEGGPMDRSQPAVLLQNRGNLYINPTNLRDSSATSLSGNSLLMSNLSYSNYAMSGSEIKSLFDKKFSFTSPNNTVNFNLSAQQNFSGPSTSGKPQLKLII